MGGAEGGADPFAVAQREDRRGIRGDLEEGLPDAFSSRLQFLLELPQHGHGLVPFRDEPGEQVDHVVDDRHGGLRLGDPSGGLLEDRGVLRARSLKGQEGHGLEAHPGEPR
jgi:hypothetical protein